MKRIWILFLCACLLTGCSSGRIEKSRLDVLRGKIDDNMYVNAYFNIVANMDDDWSVENQKNLEEQKEFKQEGSAYVVFFAHRDHNLQSASVVIEDINYNSDEESLMEKVQDSIQKDFERKEMKILSQSIEPVTYAGKDAICISTLGILKTNRDKEVPVYSRQYIIEKNRYVAIIDLCSLQEDHIEEISSNFYHLD